MVMLVGKQFTRLSDSFLGQDKEYLAEVRLGVTTDTYDCEGQVQTSSDAIPSQTDIDEALTHFQGEIEQIPPMFSAKKIGGKKLYEMARKGKTIDRPPAKVVVEAQVVSYAYPHLVLHVTCSKGTYIRSLAHDIGQHLGCGAHLSGLRRLRSGQFRIEECINGTLLDSTDFTHSAFLAAVHTPK